MLYSRSPTIRYTLFKINKIFFINRLKLEKKNTNKKKIKNFLTAWICQFWVVLGVEWA